MSSALRFYLRELRTQKHISQRELADAVGMSLRAFSDWETGKSDEMKGSSLIRAMAYMQGSWADATALVVDALSDHDAKNLASDHLHKTTSSNQDDADLQQLIQDLWEDTNLRAAFIAFWSGWKARDLSE